MLRSSALVLPMAALLALGSASCAQDAAERGEPPSESTTMNDPALEAAAASVRPWLEGSYEDTFAGIELNHEAHVLIIYRCPDALLDIAIREHVREVQVTLRHATYSLVEMTSATERVLADEAYWRERGMAINAVGPAVDGSGVTVSTSGNPEELADALSARYAGMSFDVRQQTIVFPIITSPPPAWGQTP